MFQFYKPKYDSMLISIASKFLAKCRSKASKTKVTNNISQTKYSTKCPNKIPWPKAKKGKNPREKTSTDLRSRSELVDLFFWDENGPGFAGLAEHLLSLEELALVEDHVADSLGGRGGGVEGLLDAVDEGHRDLRRLVVGAALHDELARGVRLLGLARVALRQELHARRRAWVQSVELDLHSGQELQHSLSLKISLCVVQFGGFWLSSVGFGKNDSI